MFKEKSATLTSFKGNIAIFLLSKYTQSRWSQEIKTVNRYKKQVIKLIIDD
jgi:hypothetical protein